MPASHADVARRLTANMAPGIFARGARDAVIHNDFILLERLFPGMKFATKKLDTDLWQLTGFCEDGSTVTWGVGE